MDYTTFLIRISVALVLSLIIGFERQWRRRSVGLRTNVLVCLGAFLFVSASIFSAHDVIDMKVAAQVVSGIGFLGAGVILKDGANIRGLNTAATLWSNAAIGVLCSFGLLLEATTGTFFILMANILLRKVAKQIATRSTEYKKAKYLLKLVTMKEKELTLRTMIIQNLNDQNMSLDKMDATVTEEGRKVEIVAEIVSDKRDSESIENLVSRFSIEPGVTYVGYSIVKDEEYDLDEVEN